MSESAFPMFDVSDEYADGSRLAKPAYGLTKRELFAAMAMQGALGRKELIKSEYQHSAGNNTTVIMSTDFDGMAKECVTYADALIKALESTPPRGVE